ncbi:GIY-YIG nuclease family protein [Flagellimonas nanhaiensis]|uniref:GIY-YIG nuclease family protein n=1 Tax=Flagellimonas nanhaiensis TaxID=2292706 RepID=A0A371JW48_9FLAO|nr:GIY-YIG nuclease family protein [Allomuricauda nanhaiensis]RDY62054.1 GIY-YIG nuclease family protein [Allomuricauda nanhaiensis]
MKQSFVYIMTNKYRTTFYIGVTSDLSKRIVEHHEGNGAKFTKKYNLKDLVYFEVFSDIKQAIAREKQLKNWHREWKINLIKEQNPTLRTLDCSTSP